MQSKEFHWNLLQIPKHFAWKIQQFFPINNFYCYHISWIDSIAFEKWHHKMVCLLEKNTKGKIKVFFSDCMEISQLLMRPLAHQICSNDSKWLCSWTCNEPEQSLKNIKVGVAKVTCFWDSMVGFPWNSRYIQEIPQLCLILMEKKRIALGFSRIPVVIGILENSPGLTFKRGKIIMLILQQQSCSSTLDIENQSSGNAWKCSALTWNMVVKKGA